MGRKRNYPTIRSLEAQGWEKDPGNSRLESNYRDKKRAESRAKKRPGVRNAKAVGRQLMILKEKEYRKHQKEIAERQKQYNKLRKSKKGTISAKLGPGKPKSRKGLSIDWYRKNYPIANRKHKKRKSSYANRIKRSVRGLYNPRKKGRGKKR